MVKILMEQVFSYLQNRIGLVAETSMCILTECQDLNAEILRIPSADTDFNLDFF